MSERFFIGDRVRVDWMGAPADATVWQVVTHGGNGARLKEPHYRLEVQGVSGHPAYSQSEIEKQEDARCLNR